MPPIGPQPIQDNVIPFMPPGGQNQGQPSPFGQGQYWPQQGPLPPFQPPLFTEINTEPTKKFQEEARKFFTEFGKYSADYVRTKICDLELWRHLYWGDIDVREWQKWNYRNPTLSRRRRRYGERTPDPNTDHLSGYVHPIGPSVDARVVNSYNSIFSGPQWLAIENKRKNTNISQPTDIPLEHIIQELMLDLLKLGNAKQNFANALLDWVNLGTVCGKIFWYTHKIRKWRWNGMTGKQEIYTDVAWECPIIEPVPLDMWLPDPNAMDTNVQRWRAIGNRVVREYQEIMQLFERGVYSLNKKQFKERFENQLTPYRALESSDLSRDPDADIYFSNPMSSVKLWEMHGRVPSASQGPTECCCVIATELTAESPQDGVMIRLTNIPILQKGIRPYVVGHFIPQPGAYGRGMPERNEPILFMVSQFIGQLQDVARYSTNAAYLAREGTAAAEKAAENRGPKPGEVWTTEDPAKDLQAFPAPKSETVAINQVLPILLQQLERGSVSRIFEGQADNQDTATGATLQQNQAQAPGSCLTDLFVEQFVEPACNIAIKMLEQFSDQSRVLTVRDSDGMQQEITLTPEDIQSGEWVARVVLTNQDASSIARAQSLERYMQQVPNLLPLLQQEGKKLSVSEINQRYLDALNMTGTDRIVQIIGTREQMLMQQLQMMQQQLQQASQAIHQLQRAKPQGPTGNAPQEELPSQQQQGPPPDLPPQLVTNGGPMGQEPTDQNALAQMVQLMAQQGMGDGGQIE